MCGGFAGAKNRRCLKNPSLRLTILLPCVTTPFLLPHTFRTAFGALRRNKMRSALSALGVIIAVGAVIAMLEIGEGSKTAMQKTIASMGANIILVFPGAALSGGVTFWGRAVSKRSRPRT